MTILVILAGYAIGIAGAFIAGRSAQGRPLMASLAWGQVTIGLMMILASAAALQAAGL